MSPSREIEAKSEQQTISIGSAIGGVLRPGDVICLEGELGSGKTRLAKGIVSAAAGVSPDEVVSPTFTLINSFQGEFPVHHADLYRIEGHQTDGIGLEDTVDEGGALIVEWAEKIDGFSEDPLTIVISPSDSEDARLIVVTWNSKGSWAGRIDAVLVEPKS